MKMSQCFSKRQVTWIHAVFQSIPIRAQNGDILRVVIKSSCVSQLQALGHCMSHLEMHRGVHCRGKRPLLALPPLAAGQSRQEPALAFSPKVLAFQNASQHNEPLACLSSLKLLPEQRDSRTSTSAPICPSGMGGSGHWARLTHLQRVLLYLGDHSREYPVFSFWKFSTQNSLIFLHKNKYLHFVFFLSSSFRDNYFSLSAAPTSFKVPVRELHPHWVEAYLCRLCASVLQPGLEMLCCGSGSAFAPSKWFPLYLEYSVYGGSQLKRPKKF